MLYVRPEQMEVLEQHAHREMVKRLAVQISWRCSHKSSAVSPEDFLELVREGAERAEGYGVESEPDLKRFLVYLFGNDSTFEEDEWNPDVQEILNDHDLEGEFKLDELDEYYLERDGASR